MIRAGKIAATHGLQGTLIFTHITGNSKWLKKGDVLFVALQKGSRIPYFVTQAKATGNNEYHITLEDITSMEAAKKLVGKEVYVEEQLLGPATQDSPLLWIGFDLVDREKGSLGPLTDVMQTGHQWLGAIQYNGKEVLVPLIPQMILEINTRNRFIRMELPEGLLDL
jgi:16S rRNA processing protein RimM